VEKGLRFRSFGAGILVTLAAMAFRFSNSPQAAWPGMALVGVALLLFFIVMAMGAFDYSAAWLGHAYSFAIGIMIGMPASLVLVSIADQVIHPAPFVNPYTASGPKSNPTSQTAPGP
jgi:hypothetical protein